jgi:hypothetical protein
MWSELVCFSMADIDFSLLIVEGTSSTKKGCLRS